VKGSTEHGVVKIPTASPLPKGAREDLPGLDRGWEGQDLSRSSAAPRPAIETLPVALGARSYPIWIAEGLLPSLGSRLRALGLSGRAALVSVPPVHELYGAVARESLAVAGFEVREAIVPDGESSKSVTQLSALWDRFVEHRLERGSPVVALGGGVVGDLAGFAAATYKRGVPFVQCPTTLLAQVDSSVGGKVAIDHPAGKNLIGAFHQPAAVCVDLATLRTLPRRELVAGLAEVIRSAAAFDAEFFSFLEQSLDRLLALDVEALRHAVSACCRIKAEVVAEDERESGGRRSLLNLGHTFGHALETLTGYAAYRHGEAVGWGIARAASLARRLGLCDEGVAARQEALLRRAGLPVDDPSPDADSMIDAMAHDKKAAGGKVRFVLTEKIGSANLYEGIPREILKEVLR
jgi:3-dehydroquinate synthase